MSDAPETGSARDRRVQIIYTYLTRNTWTGSTGSYQSYAVIAAKVGLSVDEVKQAVYDLRTHYDQHKLIISVPTWATNWGLEVGWRSAAMYGLANQMLHLATRENSEAVLLERAADVETDPAAAHMYRLKAAQARASSVEDYAFARAMKAKAATI